MTTRLLTLLEGVCPTDPKEHDDLATLSGFAATLAEPFSRSQWPAHFTGSAVVVDPAGERVCLLLHAKLGRWLQPGGHVEPEDHGDLVAAALREAREETGLDVSLHPSAPRPLDVDVHVIPARKTEPEHRHLDVRCLVVAAHPEALSHDPAESHGAQWLTWADALARADEPALVRLLTKARAACRPPGATLTHVQAPSSDPLFNTETLKLLLQVAWSDDVLDPKERAFISQLGHQWAVPPDVMSTLLMHLDQGKPLPQPNLSLLRTKADAVLDAAEALVSADGVIDVQEKEFLATVEQLLGLN